MKQFSSQVSKYCNTPVSRTAPKLLNLVKSRVEHGKSRRGAWNWIVERNSGELGVTIEKQTIENLGPCPRRTNRMPLSRCVGCRCAEPMLHNDTIQFNLAWGRLWVTSTTPSHFCWRVGKSHRITYAPRITYGKPFWAVA